MRAAILAFETLYWLAVAGVPLIPLYVLSTYDSAPACDDRGICFHFGYAMNANGTEAILLAMVLLWPMCAWQLVGKHIWFHFRAPRVQ